MTLFFCRGKPAARVTRTLRVKISPASAPIHVRVSSAHSAVDVTVAVIAEVSGDAVDARMGALIVLIAGAIVVRTVVRIAVQTVARIGAGIAAGDALSAAADTGMARIAGITGDTHLHAGLN